MTRRYSWRDEEARGGAGALPQVPADDVRRGDRAGARHRAADRRRCGPAGSTTPTCSPGPRGCGKTVSARILARSLNCEQGPTPEPCGVCDSCVALARDGPGSIDVIEIDAASHGGVDDARDLRERAFFAPGRQPLQGLHHRRGAHGLAAGLQRPAQDRRGAAGVRQVHLRDHRAGEGARHHPVAHPPLPVPAGPARACCGRTWSSSAREEGVAVEPAVFPLVVRAGGGSVRDSLSVLDQLIAGAGPEGVDLRAGRRAARRHRRRADRRDVDALAAGDGAAVFATVDRVVEAGHDPRRFAADLLERLRDLIVLQQVPDAVGKRLLDAPGRPAGADGRAGRAARAGHAVPAAPTSSTPG